MQSDIEGSGLTPVALIGSLHGAGTFTLKDARIAGLDPQVFDAVTGAVDKGLQIDAGRIADVTSKALDGGSLAVKQAEGEVSITAGQARLNNNLARGEGADVALGGTLDLTDGAVDARLKLSGLRQDNGARPAIVMSFKGPVSAPARTVDVSALTDWLLLRSIEDQTKRLQAIEGNRATPVAKPGKTPGPAGSVSPQH
jgi:large subunit ribosomal protein L24